MKKAVYFFILLFMFFSYGCDTNVMEPVADDSSYEAALEESRMALDKGRYDKAINRLINHYDFLEPDPEAARILSSAYMGKGGVDLTYIIELSGTEDQDSYDVIANALTPGTTSDMFPRQGGEAASLSAYAAAAPGARFIDQTRVADMLDAMREAKQFLLDLSFYYRENNLSPENDDIVKLGMASAFSFIMKVAEAVTEITGTNAPINKLAYTGVFPPVERDSLLNSLESYLSDNPEITEALVEDLINVHNAIGVMVDEIGMDEDITEDFDQFLRDILGLADYVMITEETIRVYLTSTQIMQFVRDELVN